MNKLLLLIISTLMLSSSFAQNSAKLSGDKEPKLTGAEGLYALWYKNKPNENEFLEQPYMIGGQMVFQWRELAPEKGKYDFSKIAEELENFGRRKMYTTIQINGNNKPEWLYEEVPYHSEKFSVQVRDEKGSLMYWHPTHRDAYISMLKAFADFLKQNENRKYLIGIRQNFNGFGTEHLPVPAQNIDLTQWIIPAKIDKSIEIKLWSKQIKEEYEEYILDSYIKLFDGVTRVFVRNTINESLEAKYKNQFLTGKLCWFHTSSEAEPHSTEVERQYRIFYEDCRSGKTLAFAEPWASAWGHHGKRDHRWCSPPQWFYWTQLINLHCGVSFIGLYSSDMQVALDGTYKSGDVDYKDGENGTYQKEFTETIHFAKKYVGYHDKPSLSPGAWVALRENDSILANNNQSVDGRKLSFITGDYDFLMKRLPDNSYGKNIINIGPDEQRFGAWARVLPAREQMKFRVNPDFIASCKNKSIWVKVTYFDAKGKDFDVVINNTPNQVTCGGQNKWNTKVIEIKDGKLTTDEKQSQITIQNGSENLYLHMVEVTRLFQNNANGGSTTTIQLDAQSTAREVNYGIKKLKELQQTNGIQFSDKNPDFTILAKVDSVNLKTEAYKIVVTNKNIEVTGGDAVGLMYGLLEIKNQLKSNKLPLQSKEESPNLQFRAIKFNLPWDSYRYNEALTLHYETCRDTNYWAAFLDMMAENRFNKLTLWNLHPFNYLVKTAKYPEACGFSDKEMEKWKTLWTSLFRMAKDRGIETYIINWNIFVSAEFSKAHNVAEYCQHHEFNIPQGDTSEIIKDYTRECIKATIDTYPDLAGLGITLGEGMGGMLPDERQQWILDSYIQGMRMASRKVKFIYRVPLSAGTSSGGSTSVEVEKMTRATLDTLTCFNGPINIELKFNWSHAFSTPHLVKVHGGVLNDTYWNPMPENFYLAWMMRNEDFYMLRWGQPDFMRKHIAENVHQHVNGYYVGSECYIPAKDYITSLPGASYRYAFERQWMFYKVCGQLLYNPKTPDSYFIEEFENRFPTLGKTLFDAQCTASKVPLVIASYQNATTDFTLYSEGMLKIVRRGEKKGMELISLADMADKLPMEPSLLSISDFLNNENNLPAGKISPFMLADSVEVFCKKAIADINDIQPGDNVDLIYEIADIKAWANLGLYFSNKLRAAVEYKRFLTSGDEKALQKSIVWLTSANQSWHNLVEVTQPVYQPVLLTHLMWNEDGRNFHWSIIEKQVNEELNWLKSLNTNK